MSSSLSSEQSARDLQSVSPVSQQSDNVPAQQPRMSGLIPHRWAPRLGPSESIVALLIFVARQSKGQLSNQQLAHFPSSTSRSTRVLIFDPVSCRRLQYLSVTCEITMSVAANVRNRSLITYSARSLAIQQSRIIALQPCGLTFELLDG